MTIMAAATAPTFLITTTTYCSGAGVSAWFTEVATGLIFACPPTIPTSSRVPGHDIDIDIAANSGTNLGPHAIFVRYHPGTDTRRRICSSHRNDGSTLRIRGLEVLSSGRPAEIVISDSVGNAHLLVDGTPAVGATISLALALGASVRRRSHDPGHE